MVSKELVEFIKEARERGYDDAQLEEPLLKNGWTPKEIHDAFEKLTPQPIFKNKISIYLDSEVISILEKRAKKNKFTLHEQIEDIIRRSTINTKLTKTQDDKIDDRLVTLFSRKKRR